MILSSSRQLLLAYLKDYIHGYPSSCEDDTDWDEVFQLAISQSIEGIIYRQCKDHLPENVKRRYLKQYLSSAVLSLEREKAVSEFIHLTEKKSIPVIFMKGAVFRDYHPIPAIRSMGDIDVVIHNQDKNEIDLILRAESGYERFVDNHAVWTYRKNRIYIEVHNHMFYEDLANDFDYIGYFDQIFEHMHHDKVFNISSDCLYVPDENYHFLYLMTHTAKHIINNGSGFRAYLDMVMFTRNNDHLDWEWIREELKKMNLLQFTETCFALCERWFDVKMPLPHKELDESFFEEITEKAFNDGTFGLENKANEGAHSAKEIKRDDKGYWYTAIRLTLHLLFPPYRDIILAPWYSFVKGRPYLLPIAWVYRWFYCIIHKFRYSVGRLSEPFIKRKKIEERESYIKDWGL